MRSVDHSKIKKGLFTLLVLMLVLPAIQARFTLINERPLTGAFEGADPPSFDNYTNPSWLSGDFQSTFNLRLEQNIGFRNSLVRMHNQLNFDLFNQANAEGVVIGKDRMLFEEDYIREYLGMYYVGDTVWQKKAYQLRKVQDTLRAMGKQLLVILEPGKGSFYPELFPRQYQQIEKSTSNYDAIKLHFGKAGIKMLDIDSLFLSQKKQYKAPLFTQGGTHWSYFGAAVAAQITLKTLQEQSLNVPNLSIGELSVGDTVRHPDNDIWLAMNLAASPKLQQPIYPLLEFGKVTGSKPTVLVVGDSFYYNWLNDNIPSKAFGNCEFWYYNKTITRCDYSPGGQASERDLKQEIQQCDAILIMITGRFHHAFAWNFDEQLFDLFYPGYRDPVWTFSNQLRNFNTEFSRLYNESLRQNISLERRIDKEANFLFYRDYKAHPEKYSNRRDLIRLYSMSIRSSPDWFESIKKKAAENAISIEAQIKQDATWMYEQKINKTN